jgi:hypothetical protein
MGQVVYQRDFVCKNLCFENLKIFFFFIVLLYIFQENPQESTTENTDWIIERLLNLTGGKI